MTASRSTLDDDWQLWSWADGGPSSVDRRAAVTSAEPPAAGLFSAASWCELIYCLIGLGPAIVLFVGTVTLLSVGIGLAVIYVGLLVMALGLLFARAGGHLQRLLGRGLLALPVPPPEPIRPRRPGFLGGLAGLLTDPGCWRAVGFHCLKIVLAPVQFSVALAIYTGGLSALAYPLWYRWLPLQQASDGSWHRGTPLGGDAFLDTPVLIGAQMLLGVLMLLVAPRVVRVLTTVDRVLIAALLGPRR